MNNLPAELRWTILTYLNGHSYRFVHDNFVEFNGWDTKMGYWMRYYADVMPYKYEDYYHARQPDNAMYMIFHMKDDIKCLLVNKFNMKDAILECCPYIVANLFNNGLLIIRTDELDMSYIDGLFLQREDPNPYEYGYPETWLKVSPFKLMPSLTDQLVSGVTNVELMNAIKPSREYDGQKLADCYQHMTEADFNAFYELGSYLWTIVNGLLFKHKGERYEQIIEYLLNYGPHLFNNDNGQYRRYLSTELPHIVSVTGERPYFNSRLNIFVPLSSVDGFDMDAINQYLESEWNKCVTVPLKDIELEGYVPYVAGGSLLQAIACRDRTEGWEGSDWDLYLSPTPIIRSERAQIPEHDLAHLKRNCHAKQLVYSSNIVEFFETSCNIDASSNSIDTADRRKDFFAEMFPDCNNVDHRHLQVITIGDLYNRSLMNSWSTKTKIEHIVRLFDTAVTQIYWDGDEIYLTIMALHCIKNMVNLCRADSIDTRISKYERRGFAPVPLDFDITKFENNTIYDRNVAHNPRGWRLVYNLH